MINATVIGNLGADSETRQAGGTSATNFSIASTTKVKGEDVTTWIRAVMFGARGEAVSKFLKKGKTVAVSGTLTTREYNNKLSIEMNVNELKLLGDGKSSESSGSQRSAPKTQSKGGGGFDDPGFGSGGGDDDIPFVSSAISCDLDRHNRLF